MEDITKIMSFMAIVCLFEIWICEFNTEKLLRCWKEYGLIYFHLLLKSLSEKSLITVRKDLSC